MKPMLFNTEMVRAILDGRKTMTRRIIKPQPPESAGKLIILNVPVDGIMPRIIVAGDDWGVNARYQPGDILWARETWRERWGMAYANYGTGSAYPADDVREIEYKAGGNGFFMNGCNFCPDEITVKWGEQSKWRPSIHMPKAAARIFLKVKSVKVERLQDITIEQAISEGAMHNPPAFSRAIMRDCRGQNLPYAIASFAVIWDREIKKQDIGKYGWRANPWVWVIDFERVKKP